MLKNLLIFRLIILNSLGALGLVWLFLSGEIEKYYQADTTYIAIVTCVLFLLGLVMLFIRAVKISLLWNKIKRNVYVPLDVDKFKAKTIPLFGWSNQIVNMGFLGMLLGLSLAMVGMQRALSSSGNMAVSMSEGINVAITTSIVGTGLGIWFELNLMMVAVAMECMFADYRTMMKGRKS